MSPDLATRCAHLGPIEPHWTIAELIEWLSDDARQHDATLRHPLARIEASVSGSHWARTPSTVALIRSLVHAVSADPTLRRVRILDLDLDAQHALREPDRTPQFA